MWDILYRPRKYSDVLGQDGSVRLLKTRVSNGTAFDTSYIFAGGFGRGKTTLSRIHAMAMLCEDLNERDPEPCGKCDNCRDILNEQSQAFTERDAASNGSTDAMRAIVEELPYVLATATKRIYLIDECQRMHHAAQDVLLKPIEEKKMVAMLCTTEAEKIRGAIRSRCEEYTIRKVTREDILPRMKMVLNEQGVEHHDDAVLIVIDRAEGHVRNVLNNLEMVAQLGPITIDAVREYLHLSVITLYYEILLNLDDPLKAIDYVNKACELVPPDEVASGVAEAAMNCYRMARKCFVDFSYVDRELAERVYNKYRDNVIRFAQWFSGRKNVTRLTLELDVLGFSLNAENLPPEAITPPVVFVAQTPVAPVMVASQAPQTVAAVLQAPQVPSPLPPTLALPPPTPSSPPATQSPAAAVQHSYSDPGQHTPLEEIAGSSTLPKMRKRKEPKIISRKKPVGVMEPDRWRAVFDRQMKKRTLL